MLRTSSCRNGTRWLPCAKRCCCATFNFDASCHESSCSKVLSNQKRMLKTQALWVEPCERKLAPAARRPQPACMPVIVQLEQAEYDFNKCALRSAYWRSRRLTCYANNTTGQKS